MNTRKKEEEMVEFEIEACRKNIEFYQKEIENMQEKIEELKKMKSAEDYY